MRAVLALLPVILLFVSIFSMVLYGYMKG